MLLQASNGLSLLEYLACKFDFVILLYPLVETWHVSALSPLLEAINGNQCQMRRRDLLSSWHFVNVFSLFDFGGFIAYVGGFGLLFCICWFAEARTI